jgi:hypothetical protein
MAQYPIEVDDSQAINEAVNYLLSGPAGLGQNFQGFSAYLPAYIRPSTRQPFMLPIDTTLVPTWAFAWTITNITLVGSNPTQFIQIDFTPSTALTDPPFEYGDRVFVTGVNPSFYNDRYRVLSCTTSSMIVFPTKDYTWLPYVSGGTVGRDWYDVATSTDCNARVTVLGPTDQVFVTAQLIADIEYTASMASNFEILVQINRLTGFPTNVAGDNDYVFSNSSTVTERRFAYSVSTDGTISDLETVFTTALDGPNLDFGYYWYILDVTFVKTGLQLLSGAVGGVSFSGDAITTTTTYSGLSPTTVTGAGTSAVVDVDIDTDSDQPYSDANTTITIVSGGSGYNIGDELLIPGNSLGGATPANDMTLIVTSVDDPGDALPGNVVAKLRSLTAQSIKQ